MIAAAFDYANMPEDLELDPSYGGPRDSFGASGMGLSPGMHATPDLGGMGDSYATPHAYGARRGSLDRHIDDAFGTGGGIGGLDHHGVSGEYSGLGGQYGDYGYGRDRGLGDDYMSAVDGTTYPEPARAHDAFGMGATSYDTRFRDEPSAFDSYMNRQTGYDPLGYDTALTTRDPLHAADIPTGHSLSRHSSLDHALDHSRPGAVFDSDHGHSSSYSSHHSPYFEASAGLSPHTPHTPLSSTSHLDMGHSPYEDNFEPHYDYGGFAWSGRLDNEEERYHDLDFYKQSLLRNQALDDSARENAWRERMEWENLDNEARQSRWRQLDEQKRYDLGELVCC